MEGPVLFLCPTHFAVRNVLHSRLRAELRRLGIRSTVLGVAHDGADADPEYSELEPPPLRRSRVGLSALHALQRASFYRRHHLANKRITQWWYLLGDSSWRRMSWRAVESLAVVGSRAPFYQWQMATIERLKRTTWDLDPARRRLEALQPALVVATSCINSAEEPYVMAARDLGIPTLGCVLSFDHLTDRSHTADCDFYAVWNDRMKDQLLRYHPVRDPRRVHITGTPQFDFHRQDEFRWNRADTLQHLGLAAGDRYILYAGQTWPSTPTEPEVVRELAQRCTQAPELRDHRIVLRVHPNDRFSRWEDAAASDPRIVLSLPTRKSKAFSGPDDQARLVSTLLHADACLNTWSSMSLDAAAVGTPVVCVAFAGVRGTAEDRFCGMVYDTDFYRPIVESGGVRLARSMDELVAETAAYAADRGRDGPARARLAAEECGQLDGRSAERVAGLIAGIAERALA